MGKALILVDYENEWIDSKSDYFVGDISGKIARLNKLIWFCRKKDIPIIFTTHIEPGSVDAFAAGTNKVKIIKGIDFREGKDTLIKKHKISPFFKTNLEKKLKALKANELIITGILTNLCVRSLVSDAYDRDYKITVIKDACVALSNKAHEFTLQDLKDTRPEIEFLNAGEFIKKR